MHEFGVCFMVVLKPIRNDSTRVGMKYSITDFVLYV